VTNTHGCIRASRPLLGLLAIALLAVPAPSRAGGQLIPSFGVTKSTDSHAGDAKAFGGIALRVPLMPALKLEGAIGYRQDSYQSNLVKVRQWPVSTSLWVAPLPLLYLGGGVGWYRTTLDYSEALPIADRTTSKGGVHVGGGLTLPVASHLSLDLNGRYIFMTKDKASFDVPTTFNPDYWSSSLGLAIGF
jgi:hypothetical protein